MDKNLALRIKEFIYEYVRLCNRTGIALPIGDDPLLVGYEFMDLKAADGYLTVDDFSLPEMWDKVFTDEQVAYFYSQKGRDGEWLDNEYLSTP